jgi:serine/threonine-protein kinase
LTRRGKSVKIAGFGTATYPFLRDDTIIFTPGGWTAPEQQYGGIATFQSDIYSAGAILFFLLTGKPPAYCVTSSGQLRSPRDLNPSAKRLSKVVMKAMDMDPNRRYQTAEEMRNAIVAQSKHLK